MDDLSKLKLLVCSVHTAPNPPTPDRTLLRLQAPGWKSPPPRGHLRYEGRETPTVTVVERTEKDNPTPPPQPPLRTFLTFCLPDSFPQAEDVSPCLPSCLHSNGAHHSSGACAVLAPAFPESHSESEISILVRNRPDVHWGARTF